MANRRMFSKMIIDTDIFLDMPLSTQALYFHLNMRADDDGFIANSKKIMRMVGASEDDYKILLAKQFIIKFETGVCVVKHWRIHNYIQKDRYSKTIYTEEKSQLSLDDNKIYSKELPKMDTPCIQDVNTMDTQVRLELGKDRLGKDSIDNTCKQDCENVLNQFKTICVSLPKPRGLTEPRKKAIKSRLKEYSMEDIIEVFNLTEKSDFLTGRNSSWKANFDWLLLPKNFIKVLEGNYANKQNKPKSNFYRADSDTPKEKINQFRVLEFSADD